MLSFGRVATAPGHAAYVKCSANVVNGTSTTRRCPLMMYSMAPVNWDSKPTDSKVPL